MVYGYSQQDFWESSIKIIPVNFNVKVDGC